MNRNHRKIAGIGLSVLLGFMTSDFVRGQAQGEERFIFLHLRMKDGVITLVKSSTVSGALKPQLRADKTGNIQFEVETKAGVAQWAGWMDDPSIRRYEYPDPDNPGAIKPKLVQVSEAEFAVRIPVVKDAHYLSFYRLETAQAKAPALPGTQAAKPAKSLIAKIELPAVADQ
jgi:hypothetical protein